VDTEAGLTSGCPHGCVSAGLGWPDKREMPPLWWGRLAGLGNVPAEKRCWSDSTPFVISNTSYGCIRYQNRIGAARGGVAGPGSGPGFGARARRRSGCSAPPVGLLGPAPASLATPPPPAGCSSDAGPAARPRRPGCSVRPPPVWLPRPRRPGCSADARPAARPRRRSRLAGPNDAEEQ
jgi:hypothetical protein